MLGHTFTIQANLRKEGEKKGRDREIPMIRQSQIKLFLFLLKIGRTVYQKNNYRSIPASRALSGGSVGHAISAACIKTEELSTNPIIFETGRSSAITTTLGIQSQQFSRQHSSQRFRLVRAVVHASGRLAAAKVKSLVKAPDFMAFDCFTLRSDEIA